MPKCDRCGKETNTRIMSVFNTQMICLKCKEEEKQYPDYNVAVKAEVDEVGKGNVNYDGLGKE